MTIPRILASAAIASTVALASTAMPAHPQANQLLGADVIVQGCVPASNNEGLTRDLGHIDQLYDKVGVSVSASTYLANLNTQVMNNAALTVNSAITGQPVRRVDVIGREQNDEPTLNCPWGYDKIDWRNRIVNPSILGQFIIDNFGNVTLREQQ